MNKTCVLRIDGKAKMLWYSWAHQFYLYDEGVEVGLSWRCWCGGSYHWHALHHKTKAEFKGKQRMGPPRALVEYHRTSLNQPVLLNTLYTD